MPSSKGNPTDPELREQVKEEVKAEEKGMADLIISHSVPTLVVPKKIFVYESCISFVCHVSAFLSLLSCSHRDSHFSHYILPCFKQRKGSI